MNKKEIAFIKTWLEIAGHDFETAKMILELNPVILDVACFHCQQSVEKYFKAFLSFHRVHFEKTHDVVLLKKLCSKIDDNFLMLT